MDIEPEQRRDGERDRERRKGQPRSTIVKAGKTDQPRRQDACEDDKQRSQSAVCQIIDKDPRQRSRDQLHDHHGEKRGAPAEDKPIRHCSRLPSNWPSGSVTPLDVVTGPS